VHVIAIIVIITFVLLPLHYSPCFSLLLLLLLLLLR
jgi:hypothetical protein